MTRVLILFLALAALAAAGCSKKEDREAQTRDGHVWSTQTRALEKARDVERQVLEQAERQRKQIEEQAQ